MTVKRYNNSSVKGIKLGKLFIGQTEIAVLLFLALLIFTSLVVHNEAVKSEQIKSSIAITQAQVELKKTQNDLKVANDKLRDSQLMIETLKREKEQLSREYDRNTFTAKVTGYTAAPDECGKQPGEPGYRQTTSGEYVKEGHTAAGGYGYPLGTIVYVQGIGTRTITDRGKLQYYQVDVFYESKADAFSVGKNPRKVRVIKWGTV